MKKFQKRLFKFQKRLFKFPKTAKLFGKTPNIFAEVANINYTFYLTNELDILINIGFISNPELIGGSLIFS